MECLTSKYAAMKLLSFYIHMQEMSGQQFETLVFH